MFLHLYQPSQNSDNFFVKFRNQIDVHLGARYLWIFGDFLLYEYGIIVALQSIQFLRYSS